VIQKSTLVSITPEAYFELEKWISYRKESGENITEESWILRNIRDRNKACRLKPGIVTQPRKLESLGVKRIMETALWTQGLRHKLEPGERRHEFQADHGLRKLFKTRCELAGMMPINIEILMGHSVGISDSYYRATEKELLDDYLKAIDFLTVSNEHICISYLHFLIQCAPTFVPLEQKPNIKRQYTKTGNITCHIIF
jgi:integrase